MHLCSIEEVRTEEPPIRLRAIFYEPGTVEQVAEVVRGFGDPVVAVGAPLSRPRDGREIRVSDRELRRRGVFPLEFEESGRRMFQALVNRGTFEPGDVEATDGTV